MTAPAAEGESGHDVADLISEVTTDGVFVLTLNDPATRNAVGEGMTAELLAELDRFEDDDDLGALVITGAGTAFCSGANMRGFAEAIARRESGLEAEGTPNPIVITRLHGLRKPSFAAVNGPAYGLGCGIALACDFRVAAESARFVEAFILRGVTPADGDAWRLPKLVGLSRALWMLYSGEPVTGAEAYRIGLVDWLAPDDELMDMTVALASRLAHGPRFALGLTKQLVLDGYGQDFSAHLGDAARAFVETRRSPEHEEGVRAFLEKRRPDFR